MAACHYHQWEKNRTLIQPKEIPLWITTISTMNRSVCLEEGRGTATALLYWWWIQNDSLALWSCWVCGFSIIVSQSQELLFLSSNLRGSLKIEHSAREFSPYSFSRCTQKYHIHTSTQLSHCTSLYSSQKPNQMQGMWKENLHTEKLHTDLYT